MRTRVRDWVNVRSWKQYFSFQVFIQGKWAYLSNGKRPLYWKTEAERDAKQALARKAKTIKELARVFTKRTKK